MPTTNAAAATPTVTNPPTTVGRRLARGGRFTAAERMFAIRRPRTRVLVADADRLSRRRLSQALRSRGYEVLEQQSGAALLAFLGTNLLRRSGPPPVDVMILDARMPGADGLVVLVALQRMGWDIPAILATAPDDATIHTRAPDLGAIAVLDKPLDADLVTRYVSRLY